jgi:FMN phosphatase YigB (HAD superfamily)
MQTCCCAVLCCAVLCCAVLCCGKRETNQIVLFCALQGLRKPAPEAFQVVKDTLALAPGTPLVFVDDRPANVEAAQAAGLQGLLFKGSSSDLEQQLREAGVQL